MHTRLVTLTTRRFFAACIADDSLLFLDRNVLGYIQALDKIDLTVQVHPFAARGKLQIT